MDCFLKHVIWHYFIIITLVISVCAPRLKPGTCVYLQNTCGCPLILQSNSTELSEYSLLSHGLIPLLWLTCAVCERCTLEVIFHLIVICNYTCEKPPQNTFQLINQPKETIVLNLWTLTSFNGLEWRFTYFFYIRLYLFDRRWGRTGAIKVDPNTKVKGSIPSTTSRYLYA